MAMTTAVYQRRPSRPRGDAGPVKLDVDSITYNLEQISYLSGSPPTLWWDLITDDGPLKLVDSITSGYNVPWSRYVLSIGSEEF